MASKGIWLAFGLMFVLFICAMFLLVPKTVSAISDSTNMVELDKKVYSWTSRVYITVLAPSQNLDPTKIDTIGTRDGNRIDISDRGHDIIYYKLVETGPNTGIFTGYVTLTGDPNIKAPSGVDGQGTEPTGAGPSGTGPTDGLMPAENSDGISVSFQTPTQTVTNSALIHWNIGQVSWSQSSFHPKAQGVCRIVDPDLNLNPGAIDTFPTSVWSNSDLAGVFINMVETGPNTGVFQGTVQFTDSTSSGNSLHVVKGDTITCEYNDRTLPAPYTTADQLRIDATTHIVGHAKKLEPIVSLDEKGYSWTDRVKITVVAPDLNLDPTKIDTIGNTASDKITVATRGHSIAYTLTETAPNTGIFTGYVTLTGDPNIKAPSGVDGQGTEPTGTGPSGTGPTDGLLPAQNSDAISASFQTAHRTFTASSPIQWKIGSISWLQPSYRPDGQGVCQIVDPDMNLNPNVVDVFFNTNIWSTSNSGGIRIAMTETGPNTGIFQGTIQFTGASSSGNNLQVATGDTVTCEYKDRTLPSPYTPADILRLRADTNIMP